MSKITEDIRREVLTRCEKSKQDMGFDIWDEHIKYVVEYAISLAKEYGADVEIVELGALLHDISMPSEYGEREKHNIYGAEIAEKLLTELNYPQDRIERVKKCVLNHRGSSNAVRDTIEEQCVADADVIAHFDCIPSLFHLAYKERNMTVPEGEEFIKKKLQGDYNKLSDRTRELLKDRYKNILNVLFTK